MMLPSDIVLVQDSIVARSNVQDLFLNHSTTSMGQVAAVGTGCATLIIGMSSASLAHCWAFGISLYAFLV